MMLGPAGKRRLGAGETVEAPKDPPLSTLRTETPGPSAFVVACFAVSYAACSSSLSIVNKWAILELPFPGIVTACQFFASAATVFLLGKLSIIQVEGFDKAKLVAMAPINIVFYLAIFTNGKVLQYSTIETFIAFRSLTPLLVAFLDTVLRGEPRPSLRTCGCLVAIALGAAMYAHDDANFSVRGYAWAFVYLGVIVTEMVYAKHITSTIGLSTWGLVMYQNAIAMALWPFASFFSGEFSAVYDWYTGAPVAAGTAPLPEITSSAIVPLLASCMLGVGISFAGWGTRSNISATQFTVLGVACKLITVGANVMVWSHHASLDAQFAIILCILASVAYAESAKADKAARSLKLPVSK